MKVLVACEFSGNVRDAFISRGHEALSVDLLETELPGPHYKGDIRDILADEEEWDLMVAHPPCTYLCNSGVRWLHSQPDRWGKMREAAAFFKLLLNAPIPRIAVENPIMHRYGVEIIGRRQDQVIQPWMFGYPEQKATGLWLKGLPPLTPTLDVKLTMLTMPEKDRQRMFYLSPGLERWKKRSRTYEGIAGAMADQWGRD